MKTRYTILLPLVALAFNGCGGYDKEPVADLDTLRANGKAEISKGPMKPQEIKVPVIEQKDRIVEKEVIKYEVVEKIVYKQSINEGTFVINPKSELKFIEGRETSVAISAQVLTDEKVTFRLVGKNLPSWASLKAGAEAGSYVLSGKAPYNTVTGNNFDKSIPVALSIEVISVTNKDGQPNSALKKTLDGIVREKSFSLQVLRDQNPPSNVIVEGLGTEVQEGTVSSLSITAKVPGVDQNSTTPPVLAVRYDGQAITQGNSFQELDGTRHIVRDTSKKEVEYLGDNMWKFNVLFDAKNIAAQPQLTKDGKVMATADGTRVRLSFRVDSPAGASSSSILKLVKIKYNKPMNAPRFDLSGLGQESLEVSAGSNVTLSFYVETALPGAAISVTSADIKKLPGQATLSCQNSNVTQGTRQMCTLRWKIPCDTSDAALEQQIEMQAETSLEKASSEKITQILKTVKSKDGSVCQMVTTQQEKKK